jgi:hypothetical protein
MTTPQKRKQVEDYIYKTLDLMEPSGVNTKKYKDLFSKMNDTEFTSFMEDIRDGKRQLILYAPNMKITLKMENILQAADYVKLELFERLKLWDTINKRYYVTPHKYLVMDLPVRRLKQYLQDKISIPEDDRKIDLLSGQVVSEDKASSISSVELATMLSRGLDKAAIELTNIRGGNVPGYASLIGELEEKGSANLSDIDTASRPRSVTTAISYLRAQTLDTNL